MGDEDKTKAQLSSELVKLRRQIADMQGRLRLLEMSEIAHRDAEERLQRSVQGLTLLNQVAAFTKSMVRDATPAGDGDWAARHGGAGAGDDDR